MAFFLLEIGTEELPADFVRLALPQLEELVTKDLHAVRLSFESLQVMGTPRRLAVLVGGLPTHQEDALEEHKGPPAEQAFREGKATPAAVGFARRCGLPVDQLEVRETPRGPFVFASTRQPGRATSPVLADLIPGWIWALQGRRFMRWGQGESRFSRPVRWLVALLDEEIIPVELRECDPSIRSGRLSRGHRLNPEAVAIPTASAYQPTLAADDVLVDRLGRSLTIRRQLEEAAARECAHLDLPDGLFEELVDLVEDPRVIEGGIDAPFLSLPPEVLSTVMRAHQRYVPLLRPDVQSDPLALSAEAAMVPRFLCVSNAPETAESTVRRGNERVLRARLADAAFFLQADHAIASIDRRESLERVTFAEGLGSLRDRTERLEWCTDVLLESLEIPPEVRHASRRAAHLCKHDLVSQIVGEFPELQGIMGSKYLLAEGESRDVAQAVLEHYCPRGAGDALPGSAAGALLALAERLELLLSIFSRGERPTGSSDPYGLRRAGNGLLLILWNRLWELDLGAFLDRGAHQWQSLFPEAPIVAEDLASDLKEFLRQRLISLLEDEGIDQDIVQAIAAGHASNRRRVIHNVCDVRERGTLLQHLRTTDKLASVQSVVQRASRLADKGTLPGTVLQAEGVVDPGLFEKSSEASMHAVLARLSDLLGSEVGYADLAEGLADSADTLAAFFDGPDSVLVMCEDPERRQNRLNLLGVFRNQASVLGDFTCLEG